MNGKKTIQAKYGSSEQLGQREGLSEIDVKQLRKYYECGKGTSTSGSKTTKPKKKTKRKKRGMYTRKTYFCRGLLQTFLIQDTFYQLGYSLFSRF